MGKKKNRLLGFLCFAAVLIPLFSLNVFAAGEDIFVLNDYHLDNDPTHPESKLFPPHNIAGTPGREL